MILIKRPFASKVGTGWIYVLSANWYFSNIIWKRKF